MKEKKDIEYYRQFGDGNPYFYKFLIEEEGWKPEDIERMEDNIDFSKDLKSKETAETNEEKNNGKKEAGTKLPNKAK